LRVNHKIRIKKNENKNCISGLFILFFVRLCLPDGHSQGNLLNLENLDRAEVGMTKSQIKYLLGGPVVGTPFKEDRWDYIYYFSLAITTNTKILVNCLLLKIIK
jgi:outer membrane protein assembly factor BamE (lipoprotein component of BamABCDE complex)